MTANTEMVASPESEIGKPAVPRPRVGGPVAIREAGAADLPFIDALQKEHARMVGWMPLKQLEAYVARGQVLVAEERAVEGGAEEPRASASGGVETSAGTGAGGMGAEGGPSLPYSRAADGSYGSVGEFRANGLPPLPDGRGSLAGQGRPLGYCLFRDKYFKREDCGIVHQLNVAPWAQRGLVGAALVRAAFERSAYGVRLFCCWCAQDIEANKFWEALGFVPLAFRAGSRGREDGGKRREGRIHIFWQRRVRAGDTTTPFWFPSETTGGALRESRIVLPIPPGTHWSDAKPTVLPGAGMDGAAAAESGTVGPRALARRGGAGRGGSGSSAGAGAGAGGTRAGKRGTGARPGAYSIAMGRLRFAPGAEPKAGAASGSGLVGGNAASVADARLGRREKRRNDPRFVAAARELRDRYLEQLGAGNLPLGSAGKYEVGRRLLPCASAVAGAAVTTTEVLEVEAGESRPVRMLEAA